MRALSQSFDFANEIRLSTCAMDGFHAVNVAVYPDSKYVHLHFLKPFDIGIFTRDNSGKLVANGLYTRILEMMVVRLDMEDIVRGFRLQFDDG